MRQEGREELNPTGLKCGNVEVIISSRITVPYATGLLKKRVFLPASVPANGEISAMILKHELNHIRRQRFADRIAKGQTRSQQHKRRIDMDWICFIKPY